MITHLNSFLYQGLITSLDDFIALCDDFLRTGKVKPPKNFLSDEARREVEERLENDTRDVFEYSLDELEEQIQRIRDLRSGKIDPQSLADKINAENKKMHTTRVESNKFLFDLTTRFLEELTDRPTEEKNQPAARQARAELLAAFEASMIPVKPAVEISPEDALRINIDEALEQLRTGIELTFTMQHSNPEQWELEMLGIRVGVDAAVELPDL